MDQVVIDYLNPDIPAGLKILDVPLVRASPTSLEGYGEIVRDPHAHRIEIVPWPLAGWRRLDAGTGIEGGTTEGIFACEWRGNELLGRNEAVAELGLKPAVITIIPTAASSSGQSTASLSPCRWRCPATISSRRRSSPSGRTAASASISIPASGTRACFQ